MMDNNCVLIMAGGSGTRLWPLSSKEKPKQFLDVLGVGQSLLRMTYERALTLVNKDNIYIVAPTTYEELVKSQLPIKDNQFVAEPSAKNTAPCIYYSCKYISQINPTANLLVMPSDHLITNDLAFKIDMSKAFDNVDQAEHVITFGINPSSPETGYGYIEVEKGKGPFLKVEDFHEKPDINRAIEYISSGDFYWNSGIFMWNIDAFIKKFDRLSQRIKKCFDCIDWDKFNEEEIQKAYNLCPNISVDYEIMERIDPIYLSKANFGWSDLGSWNSIFDNLPKDEDNNVCAGSVIQENSHGCFVKTTGNKTITLLDVESLIIVEGENSIMIADMSSSQRVKLLKDKYNSAVIKG